MMEIDPLLTPIKIIFEYMDGDLNLKEAISAIHEADPDMSLEEIKDLLLKTPRFNVLGFS